MAVRIFPRLSRDVDAERALVGAVLGEPVRIGDVRAIVSPEMLTDPRLQTIYRVLLAMDEAGEAIDLVTVRDQLERAQLVEQAGGMELLLDLLSWGEPVLAVRYARIVREHHVRRLGAEIGQAYMRLATGDRSLSLADLAERSRRLADEELIDADRPEPIVDVLARRQVELRVAPRSIVPTGVPELDDVIDGFGRGTLSLIAARPAMGKTAFALHLLRRMAEQGQRLLLFSLETPKSDLADRLIAQISGIRRSKLRLHRLDEDEHERVRRVLEQVQGWRLAIDDCSGLTTADIGMRARDLSRRWRGLDAVFVDHLHLLADRPDRSTASDQMVVATIAHRLSALARDLDVAVVALCQLSRAPESRADKEPHLSDLRESGHLEQDARLVLLLYRPGYYSRDHAGVTEKDELRVIVGKANEGQAGISIRLPFYPASQRIWDAKSHA